MKKLSGYLKSYKKQTVLAPLFKMLEALLELTVPLIIKKIIDVGIASSDVGYIVKMCVLLAFIALTGLGFSITAQYFAAKAAAGFSADLKASLISHIGTLSYTEIDSIGTSEIISRMTTDVNRLQNGVNLTLRLLLRSPFIVFGAMIMAFTVDSEAAVTFVITIPVLSAAVFTIMLSTVPLYKKVQKNLDTVLSSVRSTLNGVRVLRAFGTESRDIEDFRKKNDRLTLSGNRAGRISALLNPLTYVIINIATAVLIYVGALRVDSGVLTGGAVVALYNYMAQILVELIKLANLIITITKAAASAGRINELFSASSSLTYPEISAEPDTDKPAVKFSHVSLTYKNAGEESLSDISFSVNKGETAGITGSTGSGKTSLINLIPRFYDASTGSIEIFGSDIKNYSKQKLTELISVVPQHSELFSGTVKDNILWGNKNADSRDIERAVRISQCEDIIKSKHLGLDENVLEGGKNFSGGQKQRIAIARAVIKNAPVLILDGSFSALDGATDLKLRQELFSMDERPAMFIVSERISSIKDCDKIFVLDEGRLAGAGTHDELIKNCSVYKEIYASQTGGAEI